jgi:hypothetical protein
MPDELKGWESRENRKGYEKVARIVKTDPTSLSVDMKQQYENSNRRANYRMIEIPCPVLVWELKLHTELKVYNLCELEL